MSRNQTTCAKAGAQYGTQLIWALVFSTLATILLQELVARVSMATGKNIGDILSTKYQSSFFKISKFCFLPSLLDVLPMNLVISSVLCQVFG
ncbi:MAG: divalent metal cation transporter [Saprospiraceae bacterium]|nr:divalent metal cation transporter [Saprospiraceae bacterium]